MVMRGNLIPMAMLVAAAGATPDFIARLEAQRPIAFAAGSVLGIARACEVPRVETESWRRHIELRWRVHLTDALALQLIELMRDAAQDGYRAGLRQRAAACPEIRHQMHLLEDTVNRTTRAP